MKSKDDLPEYTAPILTGSWNPLEAVAMGEYTGANWSDGKRQGSVAKGKLAPTSQLDILSQSHDSSYATCDSLDCLTTADEVYMYSSRDMSFIPRTIGKLPYYGNMVGRAIAKFNGGTYHGSESLGGKMNENASDNEIFSLNSVSANAQRVKDYNDRLSRFLNRGSLPPVSRPTLGSGEVPDPQPNPTKRQNIVYEPVGLKSTNLDEFPSDYRRVASDSNSYARKMYSLFGDGRSLYKNKRTRRARVYCVNS